MIARNLLLTSTCALVFAACSPSSTTTPTIPSPAASATVFVTATMVGADARPFPQHVTYAAGSIKPSDRTQQQLDDDVRAFYDYWKATYVVDAGAADGKQLYRIAYAKDNPQKQTTVSEGQGYGMVIVPLMAGYDPQARQIFDGLLAFARAHPSENDSRLMDWNVPKPDGNGTAFDGDADIAFGLLLADAQWGSSGTINYKAQAETMIAGIRDSTIGPQSHLPMLGDWVQPAGDQYNQYTPRSSDFMLVDFRAFGKATRDALWTDVVTQSQNVLVATQGTLSPQTGLIPDFYVIRDGAPQPAPPKFLEASTDGDYNYNAGRVPWRVGLDALINDDPRSRAIAVKISQWLESATGGDAASIRSGYRLDGRPLPNSDYFSTFFVAPVGVAAMNDPNQQHWLNSLYDAVHSTHIDYYEDTVTLQCLLAMSGNFWEP